MDTYLEFHEPDLHRPPWFRPGPAERWQEATLDERVAWCRECGESIFSARHDEPPAEVAEYLRIQIHG